MIEFVSTIANPIVLWQVLRRLQTPPIVFITHHHHDHVEGLPVLWNVFPTAEIQILGHPNTLKRIPTNLFPLGAKYRLVSVCEHKTEEIIAVGSIQVTAIAITGHTDGHLVLFDQTSRTLVAGDHIVGWGSGSFFYYLYRF